jgi:ring-1,2-phenylacetyl-CoA epoxidase subunit PaaE
MSLSVEQLTRPLKVAKRIQETPDAVSLVLEIPKESQQEFHYQAGQFVTFFLEIGGETISRSYSLSSSPIVDTEFKITVKKVPGGKGSTFLCDDVKEGQILRTTKPSGHFFKPSLETTQYFLNAAGSGITPVFSILKTVLNSSEENEVHLLYCNRNEDSIIFRNEIAEWQKKFDGRLHVHHLLSQPSSSWTGAKGRFSTAWLDQILKLRKKQMRQEFYVCGPDGFMSAAVQEMQKLGIDKSLIRQESFAVGLQMTKSPDLNTDWTYIGDKSQATTTSGGHLVAVVQGETVECEVQPDQSILEALIEAGANPPYSCMDGACMACLAKVQEGLVYQKDPGILSDENVENRETLTCQARVLSRNVKVSYDDI